MKFDTETKKKRYNFGSIQNQDQTLETFLFMQDLQNLYTACRFYVFFECIYTYLF